MIDFRSSEQPVWVYRWFGQYDNVLGPGLAASHGSEVPSFYGGNECFSQLSHVTYPEQQLADTMNDWLVAWIKNPTAGPGWEQASPVDGPLAKIGVPGHELQIEMGWIGEFNARCRGCISGIFLGIRSFRVLYSYVVYFVCSWNETVLTRWNYHVRILPE